MILQVPTGEVLTFGDDNFVNFEAAGIREAKKAAFVLVAGGLGERLGYNGIKVTFTIEIIFKAFSSLVVRSILHSIPTNNRTCYHTKSLVPGSCLSFMFPFWIQ